VETERSKCKSSSPAYKTMANKDVLKNILEEGQSKFSKTKVSPKDKKAYGKLHGKESLLTFCQYMNPEFQVSPHLKLISDKLELVAKGKVKQLMINMPPRHGKSELATRLFPIWYLGNHPKAEIIIASAEARLAVKFTRGQRSAIESEDYQALFPAIKPGAKWEAGEWELDSDGSVKGAGVGGSIIGRGADLIVIDDVFSNYENAISEVNQETVWNWYRYVLRTRLSPGGSIVIVNTRWVSGDLCGRLIEQDKTVENGGKWDLLKLPAINPDGSVLWKERFSLAEIQDIREGLGEKIFGAVYQQEPIDIQEKLFALPVFEERPSNLKLIAYLDPAFGGSDYSALTIGGLHEFNGIKIYIAAGEIWKGQVDVTYDTVEKLCKKYKVSSLYLESNQSQRVLQYELQRRGLHVQLVNNIQNKHLRIINGVKLNWHLIRFSNSMNADYMKQVLNYSELSSHDDAPDSLAGLLWRFKEIQGKDLTKRYGFVNFLRAKF